MSRAAASSTSAWVDGPKASRSARRMRRSSSASRSKACSGSSGSTRWLTSADGHPAGLEPDLLLAILVDDVVVALRSGRAGLAVAGLGAGEVLQLEGDVLGDVAEPGPLAEPADEAAATAQRAGVVVERREHADEGVGEVRDRVARPALEVAEVDEHPDDRLRRPVVRAAQDPALEDPEASGGPAVRAAPRGRRALDAAGCGRSPSAAAALRAAAVRRHRRYSDAASPPAIERSAGVAIRTRRRRSKR